MRLLSLPNKPGLPMLVPYDEDRQAAFVSAVNEKVRHLREWIEPPAARRLGPEFRVIYNNLPHSHVLLQESFGRHFSESTEVALQDFIKIALRLWVKRVFHPSLALSLARASSPGTNCTLPAAI